MNKRVIRKTLAVVLSLALTFAYTPSSAHAATKSKSSKKPVGFKISKSAGTYEKKVTVKVKAKKNYKVYYATGKKFKKSKVIKAGKSKKFTFKKTTTLKLLSVKKSKKVSTKKLNKMAKKSKRLYKYKYVISKNEAVSNADKKDDKKKDDKKDNTTEKKDDKKDDKKEEVKTPEEKNDKPLETSFNEKDIEVPEVVYEDNTKVDEEASKVDETTPVMTFTEEGVKTVVNGVETEVANINVSKAKETTRVIINADGTYAFTGEVKDVVFFFTEGVKANLIFDNFKVDDSQLAEHCGGDNSVFSFANGTDIKITLVGKNTINGNATYKSTPKAIINQNSEADKPSTLTIVNGGNGELDVVDGIAADTFFGPKDPVDGIATKGTFNIKSGNINVTSTGDCLKATGAKGEGGVKISGGNLKLTSYQGAAIKSKNGTIDITGGVVEVLYAADDAANAKNYSVNISGGYFKADNVYGDGIQANDVNISGGDIVIKTYFENAGLNYYNKDLGEGNYNTNIKHDNFSSSSKEEYINVDLGSHKGIKAGSKDYYYTYKTVKEGSKKVAGEEYHDEATGGVNITGGNIFLDTTATGIKYTAGGPGMMPPVSNGGDLDLVARPDMQVNADEEQLENPGQGQQGEGFNPGEGFMPPPPNMNVDNGNLTTAGEGQLMLGCPEDGVKSQTSLNMSGGKLVINASDDGISVIDGVTVTGDSKIYINKAYEGVEAKDIVFGTKDGNDNPYLYVYTNDDGINATEKYRVEYVYEDESEAKYARTTYSRTGGSLTVYNGELDINIADDKEQEYSLSVAHGLGVLTDGCTVTGAFTASGDGIDCNGSMYAYGGRVIVSGGASSTGNSPIDCNDTYYIGEGAVVYAEGDMGMPENPTELKQAMIMFGGDNGMMGPPPGFDPSQGFPGFPGEGFNPGEGFMPPPPPMRDPNEPSALGIEAGSFYKIVDSEGNVILTGFAKKKINYMLLSSPELKDGVTYTLIAGEVSTEFTATTVAPERHGGPGMPPEGVAYPDETVVEK